MIFHSITQGTIAEWLAKPIPTSYLERAYQACALLLRSYGSWFYEDAACVDALMVEMGKAFDIEASGGSHKAMREACEAARAKLIGLRHLVPEEYRPRFDELLTAMEKEPQPATAHGIYVTSYCNKPHFLADGRPVEHECYVLPAAALVAERDGDIAKATDIMGRWTNRREHAGVRMPKRTAKPKKTDAATDGTAVSKEEGDGKESV